MLKALKNIVFFILILAISGAVYWIIYLDSNKKQDSLEYALRLVGKDLLAKVKNEEDKEIVETKYDEFLQKAQNNELDPEKVEQIAANIINISNAETTLTSQQAEKLLSIAYTTKDSIFETPSSPKYTLDDIPEPPPPIRAERPELDDVRRRIIAFHSINKELKDLARERKIQFNEENFNVVMQPERGMKIKMDPRLMHEFNQIKEPRFEKQLKEMEADEFIIMERMMNDSLKIHLKNIRTLLDTLQFDSTELHMGITDSIIIFDTDN